MCYLCDSRSPVLWITASLQVPKPPSATEVDTEPYFSSTPAAMQPHNHAEEQIWPKNSQRKGEKIDFEVHRQHKDACRKPW